MTDHFCQHNKLYIGTDKVYWYMYGKSVVVTFWDRALHSGTEYMHCCSVVEYFDQNTANTVQKAIKSFRPIISGTSLFSAIFVHPSLGTCWGLSTKLAHWKSCINYYKFLNIQRKQIIFWWNNYFGGTQEFYTSQGTVMYAIQSLSVKISWVWKETQLKMIYFLYICDTYENSGNSGENSGKWWY